MAKSDFSCVETRFSPGFCHRAFVLQAQVPKLCTDLDLSLLYISRSEIFCYLSKKVAAVGKKLFFLKSALLTSVSGRLAVEGAPTCNICTIKLCLVPFFFCCYAATQLALQVQHKRSQVVCRNKEAQKRLTDSNGTPAMDIGLGIDHVCWYRGMCV